MVTNAQKILLFSRSTVGSNYDASITPKTFSLSFFKPSRELKIASFYKSIFYDFLWTWLLHRLNQNNCFLILIARIVYCCFCSNCNLRVNFQCLCEIWLVALRVLNQFEMIACWRDCCSKVWLMKCADLVKIIRCQELRILCLPVRNLFRKK